MMNRLVNATLSKRFGAFLLDILQLFYYFLYCILDLLKFLLEQKLLKKQRKK